LQAAAARRCRRLSPTPAKDVEVMLFGRILLVPFAIEAVGEPAAGDLSTRRQRAVGPLLPATGHLASNDDHRIGV
jgi:hypothetical protein